MNEIRKALEHAYEAGIRQGKWLVINTGPVDPRIPMQPDMDKVIDQALSLLPLEGETRGTIHDATEQIRIEALVRDSRGDYRINLTKVEEILHRYFSEPAPSSEKALKTTGWISVNERLPTEDDFPIAMASIDPTDGDFYEVNAGFFLLRRLGESKTDVWTRLPRLASSPAPEAPHIDPLDMIGTLPDKVHIDLPGGHAVKAAANAPEAPKSERHLTLHVEVIKGIPMVPLAEAEEYAKFKVESKRSAAT